MLLGCLVSFRDRNDVELATVVRIQSSAPYVVHLIKEVFLKLSHRDVCDGVLLRLIRSVATDEERYRLQ